MLRQSCSLSRAAVDRAERKRGECPAHRLCLPAAEWRGAVSSAQQHFAAGRRAGRGAAAPVRARGLRGAGAHQTHQAPCPRILVQHGRSRASSCRRLTVSVHIARLLGTAAVSAQGGSRALSQLPVRTASAGSQRVGRRVCHARLSTALVVERQGAERQRQVDTCLVCVPAPATAQPDAPRSSAVALRTGRSAGRCRGGVWHREWFACDSA